MPLALEQEVAIMLCVDSSKFDVENRVKQQTLNYLEYA